MSDNLNIFGQRMSHDEAAMEGRIQELQHAMQTGVLNTLQCDGVAIHDIKLERELKHLRVGINSAMINHSALVAVLVDKGIITFTEYQNHRLTLYAAEVRRYEQTLSARMGVNVTLI